MGQEEALARTHEGEPGLPRGRSGLPIETVRAAQRERLLRAVIAAVAGTGYTDLTVADIVRGARVSKAAFYVHFAGKEDCFLAATREGGWLMINQVAGAARRVPAGAGAEEALRAGIAAFLEFLAREPAFARAFYVDMPAAGPRAVARIEAGLHNFARLNRAWHERARRDHPEWPVVPYQAYYALRRRHGPAGPGAGQPGHDRLRAGAGRHAGRPPPGCPRRPADGRGPRAQGRPHGAWPSGNCVTIPRRNGPRGPGGGLTGEGLSASQYASATAPVRG